jgi:hypothetical protein
VIALAPFIFGVGVLMAGMHWRENLPPRSPLRRLIAAAKVALWFWIAAVVVMGGWLLVVAFFGAPACSGWPVDCG